MTRILVVDVLAAFRQAGVTAMSGTYLRWANDVLLGSNALGIMLIDKLGGEQIRDLRNDGSTYEWLIAEHLKVTTDYRKGHYSGFAGLTRDDYYLRSPDYIQGHADGRDARLAILNSPIPHSL